MDRYVPLPPLPARISRLNELAYDLWWRDPCPFCRAGARCALARLCSARVPAVEAGPRRRRWRDCGVHARRGAEVDGRRGVPGPEDGRGARRPAKGASHFFIKLPAGFSAPVHYHNADHWVAVVTGTLMLDAGGRQGDGAPRGFRVRLHGEKASRDEVRRGWRLRALHRRGRQVGRGPGQEEVTPASPGMIAGRVTGRSASLEHRGL